jgi:hypothetical protein
MSNWFDIGFGEAPATDRDVVLGGKCDIFPYRSER